MTSWMLSESARDDVPCRARFESVGASLPETVVLREIPDYEYRYVYLNNQPVLVEPSSRRIVYVMR